MLKLNVFFYILKKMVLFSEKNIRYTIKGSSTITEKFIGTKSKLIDITLYKLSYKNYVEKN